MAARHPTFTTIRAEGALLPADFLQRLSEGADVKGLTPESYHRPGEKLNEAINRAWNTLQGAWASFKAARESLSEHDPGTTLTRERWLLPLFRELDYGRLQTAAAVEIDGRSFAISHQWGHVPIHLVSFRLDLDKRSPGTVGASTASPHSLMQLFLNRSPDHLWGFVSNGRKLRLLRDNRSLTRQAYVEFDLEAMMDSEAYSDFVLLWLLCHQSRVEATPPADCWLERWAQAAQEEGTRALDQLRDSVQQAIEALGLGFLEYHANAALRDKLSSGQLSPQDYYRQLLRLVYRLLFLFVAEDRDLLLNPDAPPDARERYRLYYSTQRLRRMAESFRGTRHTDLFEGLRLVMRLLSGEAPTEGGSVQGGADLLGLGPLGSFLFSAQAVPDLIDCQISNQRLLGAVHALTLTYDERVKAYRTVDYRHLGTEELGSVFESLLELHPQLNVPARSFALQVAAGSERKTTGSYYTPEALVNALLDSALEPVLAQAINPSPPTPRPQAEAFRVRAEERILALKVCDPACGSGHFLIAVARRLAAALARARSGEDEPPPAALQQAKRDVISHCLYGVDLNPMAVELCKVNLWMEALDPGKPLSFLDHRILVGNSLIGATPRLMAEGIPDDAFTPIEGDDPKRAAAMKKTNRQERKDRQTGQRSMFERIAPPADYHRLSTTMQALDAAPDDTLDAVRRKEAEYAALARDPAYVKARLLADAWCAAFMWEKAATPCEDGEIPLTDLVYRRLERDPLAPEWQPLRAQVVRLAERYQFFHWHIAFPDVFSVDAFPPPAAGEGATGWNGGFDLVLGNPPWERIKIQEKEWFAQRAPDIARAPNAAARKRMIADLCQSDPALYAAFAADLRKVEGESHFVRVSGRYPLCGRGDVNTYTLFAETTRHILNGAGRIGLIVPSGIATDDTTKFFFQDLVQTNSLVSFYHFDNRSKFFPDVGSMITFALVTLTALTPDPSPGGRGEKAPPAEGERLGARATPLAQEGSGVRAAEFAFFLHRVADLEDPERRFTLTAEDIALINPNTRTVATFRSKRDAEITKAIYRRIPILIQETPSPLPLGEGPGVRGPGVRGPGVRGPGVREPGVREPGVRARQNPWGIRFATMFHMSNDSHLFRTRAELEAAGFVLQGNRFVASAPPPQADMAAVYLPLYEAKMIHHFNHRWATYTASPSRPEGEGPEVTAFTPDELRSPHALPLPRYWVDEREVQARLGAWDRGWLLGFRDIARSTDERTAIFGLLPRVAVGNKIPILLSDEASASLSSALITNNSTYVFDFAARQKLGGTTMNFFYVKQFPVIPPWTYTPALLGFIAPRVLELTYTAWDMQPFARDLGDDGPPFVWDDERRFLIRCELDALYFHLYQIPRDDVEYIMETFPIVKRKDEAAHGQYRTKRVILEMFDQMAALPRTAVPAPKGGENAAAYLVPDVSQWTTQLNPPPGARGAPGP